MAYFRHWRGRFHSSSEQIGHAIPPMAKIYSCQKILTDETGARGSSSHSRTIGQLSEALIFPGTRFRADIIQRHAGWLSTGCCLGLPGGLWGAAERNSFISPAEMLHHLSQDGTEIALSSSEGGSSEGSLRISSWYECFIPQIGFLTRRCQWDTRLTGEDKLHP